MTTQEFIAKTYNTKNEKWGKYGYERRCSSVLTDKDGIVYSYGYHYPLAFHVAGHDFVNTLGYSSTTAKHIAWARRSIENPIEVKLWRVEAQVIASSYDSEEHKIEMIKTALHREINSIKTEMQSKTRKNTNVYVQLENDLLRVRGYWNRVTA